MLPTSPAHGIRGAASLPAVGAEETAALEFKGEPGKVDGEFDHREMAKDVAAMSNAAGGVILIGAYHARGRLGVYKGFGPADASAVKDGYEKAVAERCSPAPIIDVVTVPSPGGNGEIVCVNVFPFPGAAVGVLWIRDGGALAYAYPVRVGTHTIWLQAVQTAMWMSAEVRRFASLLATIPESQRTKIKIVGQRGDQPRASWEADLTLEAIDMLGNAVTFSQVIGPGATHSFSIPLDAITSVWLEAGFWRVAFRGQVDRSSGVWRYFPRWGNGAV